MGNHDEPGFTAAVSAITDAFGDPTRRRIYLLVRRCGESGATVSAVADEIGIHPNVARHHLDKLTAGGYLLVGRPPVAAAGAAVRRAGRPSKRYVVATADDAGVLPPVRGDGLVLALLGSALQRLSAGDAEAMAEEVGADYGRALAAGITGTVTDAAGDETAAAQRTLRSAMQAVADALTAHGFAAHTDIADDSSGDSRLRIVSDHCPFGTLAVDHPVLCAVDRGLVRGMLGALHPPAAAHHIDLESSRARGDDVCTTAV